MQNGIFHNRLKHKLRNFVIHDFIRHVYDKIYFILESHILQFHIQAHMPQFLPDRNRNILLRQGQFIELRQSLNRNGYFFLLPALRQPVDHIQHIIKEMGIDLRLQGLYFGYLQFLRRFRLLRHQVVNAVYHHIIIAHQLPDLILVFVIFKFYRHLIPILVHLFHHFGKPPRYAAGQGQCHAAG